MAEPKVTNMVKFYAMLLLLEKKQHGYELMKQIGSRLEKKVSPGQMYPFLAELQKNKFVKITKSGGRDKTEYELTSDGKKFAGQMLHRFGGLLEIALKPHLTVCTHCGCKVFEGGVTKTIHGKKLKFCCGHCAASFEKNHRH